MERKGANYLGNLSVDRVKLKIILKMMREDVD
jgi:hypothetical protein